MKQLLCGLLVSIALCLVPLRASAAAPDLIISEVKVRNTSATQTDEFIELYNPMAQALNLAAYSLEYFNMSDPVAKPATVHKGPFALPSIVLEPGALAVLAIKPTIVVGSEQLVQITSLKDEEGSLRLSKAGASVDAMAWKKGSVAAGVEPVPTQASHSLQRDLVTDGWVAAAATSGEMVEIVAEPEVALEEVVVAEEVAAEVVEEASVVAEESPPVAAAGVHMLISELLPNPMAPQADGLDEFVELYNPGTEPIALAGYTIETGAKYSYSYKIPGGSLAPGAYVTYTSGATSLSLANSGGRARVIAPDGTVIYETQAYAQAAEGQAWALMGDTWQWTATPTAGGANTFSTPVAAAANPKVATAKTTKPKAAAKPKAKAATKAAATKKVAADKPKAGAQGGGSDPAAPETSSLHPAIVAAIGLLGVAYAAYEYRQDIANRFYQFRRYRAVRREARAKA